MSHVVIRHSLRTHPSVLPSLFITVRVRGGLKCTRQFGVAFKYSLSLINPCYGREDVTVYPHFHYPRVTTTCTSDSVPHGRKWFWRTFGAAFIRYLRPSEVLGFQPRSSEAQVKRLHTQVSAVSCARFALCLSHSEVCAIFGLTRFDRCCDA